MLGLPQKISIHDHFQCGRDGFRAILRVEKARGSDVLWLPEYLCGTISEAAKKEKFNIEYYHLGPDLSIKAEEFVRLPRGLESTICLIDYFGLLNLDTTVEKIRNWSKARIIIDEVQALHENRDFGADYCLRGYRKFLPVPEGAYVSSKWEIPRPENEGTAGLLKLLGCLVKREAEANGIPDSIYLQILRRGEERFDLDDGLPMMSPLGKILLEGTDMANAETKRIKNAEVLVKLLERIGLRTIIPLPRGVAPLAIPIGIERRDEVRSAMKDANIFLAVHWPDSTDGAFSTYLKHHELSLVIDQRYDENDMERQVDLLASLGVRDSVYDA